jgi:iron complex outermembrane receptor protein
MRVKQLAVAIALIGAGAAINAQAEEKVNKVERVEVTGSSIKRIKKEAPTAVQVVTKEQIQATGATTVNEVFLKSAAFSSYNDEANATGAPGRATVGFRQLTADDVLILLNGRRLAKNGVNGSAYDLNSIPAAAVERIDILKDGASAVYGSDAIAGVINIITKKNLQGGEVTTSYGISSDGDGAETRLAAAFGYGDIEEQGFNLLVTAEKFDRDAIFRRDRAITSMKGPTSYNEAALTFNRVSPSTNGKFKPVHACAEPLVTDSKGTYCPYYFNQEINLTPESHRQGLFGLLNIALGENNRLFIEALSSTNDTVNSFSAAPGSIKGIKANNPTNPFGEDISNLRVRFNQGGPRTFLPDTEYSRYSTGLEGSISSVDYKFNIGRNVSKTSELSKNFFDFATLGKDVNAGTIDILTKMPTKDQLSKYFVSGTTKTETIVDSANLGVSTTLFDLPAGPLGIALGLSYNKESLSIDPDAISQAGRVSATGNPKYSVSSDLAKRTVSSAFFELSVPILKELEAQIALRYDKYSDVGAVTTPKIALRWEPSSDLLFRGSYSEGFRAPGFEDLYQGPTDSAEFVKDTQLCQSQGIAKPDCATAQVEVSNLSNSTLKPEKSKSFAMGLVFAPTSSLTTSLDYYWIQKNDAIDRSLQYLIDNPNFMLNGRPASSYIKRAAAPAGQIGAIESGDNPLNNVAQIEVSGLEWGLEYKFPRAEWGQITVENQVSYNLSYEKAQAPGEKLESYLNLMDRPQVRDVLRVSYVYGGFTLNTFIRSMSGFYDAQTPGDKTDETAEIPSFTTVDLTASYKDLFVKGFSINGGAKNIFNRTPTTSTADNAAGFPTSQSAVGPFYYMGAGYKF